MKDDERIINELTGRPMKTDETALFTPDPELVREYQQRNSWHIRYALLVFLLALPFLWASSALGLHPFLGASIVWAGSMLAPRAVRWVRKERHHAAGNEAHRGPGQRDVHPDLGDPTD